MYSKLHPKAKISTAGLHSSDIEEEDDVVSSEDMPASLYMQTRARCSKFKYVRNISISGDLLTLSLLWDTATVAKKYPPGPSTLHVTKCEGELHQTGGVM